MRRLICVFILVLCACFGTNLYACDDCAARHCLGDGPKLVCDEIIGHGCIASGTCPQGPMGCIKGNLTMQVASVQVLEPRDGNFFLSNLNRKPLLFASTSTSQPDSPRGFY
jgi:hypothetical protein